VVLPDVPFRVERLLPDPEAAAVQVWVGGRALGRVHASAPAELGLAAGTELAGEAVRALRAALDARAAFEDGARQLGRRARARGALERSLAAAWGAAAATDAVERLGHYLDDAAFAQDWVEGRLARSPQGPDALLAGLARQGVPADVARRTVAALAAGDRSWTLCLAAAARGAARYGHLPPAQRRARLWGYLARRGFDEDLVAKAVAQVEGASEPGAEAPSRS
jgi:regulatory protein